ATARSSNSCRALTRRRLTSQTGIARALSARRAEARPSQLYLRGGESVSALSSSKAKGARYQPRAPSLLRAETLAACAPRVLTPPARLLRRTVAAGPSVC